MTARQALRGSIPALMMTRKSGHLLDRDALVCKGKELIAPRHA
jgi:hypothetical protein